MKVKNKYGKRNCDAIIPRPVQRVVSCVFEISGYGCILPQVQNYYPVEKDKPGMWYWGFKYNSGVFEFFYHSEKQKAEKERQSFVNALEAYWAKR